MVAVARKVLTESDVKPKYEPYDRRALALRFLGMHGSAADLPLVMKYADIVAEVDRIAFSKLPNGESPVYGGRGGTIPLHRLKADNP